MDLIIEAIRTIVLTIRDVLPIAVFLILFHRVVLRRKLANLKRIVFGFGLVVAGLGLFLLGLEKALFPLGRLMAEQLATASIADQLVHEIGWDDFLLVYAFAFCIAFGTTVAEPSLLAVSMKASEVSGGAISVWGLRVAVALGVGVGVALGCFRIVTGTPLHWYIAAGYVVVVIQTAVAPRLIVPLAFDSGGVTTSTVTVPIVAALGLGLAENIAGRDPLLDGFGLIAFASLFPIISVLGYAQLSAFADQRRAKRRRLDENKANHLET
jgi:hypothetical protein